jgi:hypothetical protein
MLSLMLNPMIFTYWEINDTDGWEGRRSNAGTHPGGELNCETAGIEDFAFDAITMFPNPATSEVFVSFDASLVSGDIEISITNSLGQVLQNRKETLNGDNQTSFNVSNYRTGLYFVTLKAGNQITTKKLLVK